MIDTASLSANELVSKLKSGDISSVDLCNAYIKRIEKFILSKDRKLVGWDEILEGGLAKSATVMSWRGMDGGIESAKAGHDVIMCPTSHCYFDYYQANPETSPKAFGGYTTLKKVYSQDIRISGSELFSQNDVVKNSSLNFPIRLIFVETNLLEKELKQNQRPARQGVFYPSALGSECDRYLYNCYHGLVQPETISAISRRIFDCGDYLGYRYEKYFEKMKMLVCFQ